ncbi:17535_t:CDS:1, partial [Racocetra fulgida]
LTLYFQLRQTSVGYALPSELGSCPAGALGRFRGRIVRSEV